MRKREREREYQSLLNQAEGLHSPYIKLVFGANTMFYLLPSHLLFYHNFVCVLFWFVWACIIFQCVGVLGNGMCKKLLCLMYRRNKQII